MFRVPYFLDTPNKRSVQNIGKELHAWKWTGFIRTLERTKNNENVNRCIAAARQYAYEHGLCLVGEGIDTEKSKKSHIAQYKRLREALKKKEADAVLPYSLGFLGRDAVDIFLHSIEF